MDAPLQQQNRRLGRLLDIPGSAWTPSEGWFTVGVAVALNLVVVVTIQRSGWVSPSPRFWLVALLAIATGLAVAKLRGGWLREPFLHLAALGLGAGVALWETAGTISSGAVAPRLREVAARLADWITAAGSSGISNDRLPFGLMLVALTWLICFYTTWFVFRHRWGWPAVVLPAIALMENQTYLPNSRYPVPLAFFLLFAILLLGRLHYHTREDEWRRHGIARRGGGFAFTGSLLVVTVAVLAVGWAIPAQRVVIHQFQDSYHTARAPWADLEDEWERVFAGVPSKKASALHSFGLALPLRGGVSLGNDLVFLVTTDYPAYWRAQTYDVYQGRGWLTEGSQRESARGDAAYSATGELPYKKREPVAQRVTVAAATDVVFMAAQPLDVAVPSRAEIAVPRTFELDLRAVRPPADLPEDLARAAPRLRAAQGDPSATQRALPTETKLLRDRQGKLELTRESPATPDILSVRSTSRMRPGTSYEVLSSVSVATEADLRGDSSRYPKWVTDNYLQLPSALPQRVKELAVQVTRGAGNPYDKSQAIAGYLHTFPQTLRIDPPPVNADAVDYFLFNLRAGYSDYFASAMTVMLRAAGTPARLVTGYASGAFDEKTTTFSVTFSDAHSWPEVYFPSYGWIPFEASPRFQAIPRGPRPVAGLPEDIFEAPQDSSGAEDPFLFEDQLDIGGITRPEGSTSVGTLFLDIGRKTGLALGAVAGVLALALLLLSATWQLHFVGLPYPHGIYERMRRLGSLAGLQPAAPQTPREYALALAENGAMPSEPTLLIAEGFMRVRYSGRPAMSTEEQDQIQQAWRTVRGALLKRIAWRAGPRRLRRPRA